MATVIYLSYIKEYRYMRPISSHRTSDGFKYTVQDEEEICGPLISSLPFKPSYQEALAISEIIKSKRDFWASNEDDDCWAESFNLKDENKTEYIGDLGISSELNTLLGEKYNICFISTTNSENCSINLEHELLPLTKRFDIILDLAKKHYESELEIFAKRIKDIKKEQELFEGKKDIYLINLCSFVFRKMVSDNEIDVNERVQTLYNKYPLDIAEICNDKDTYLQLIENGAYNTDNYLSVNYALDNINIKALNIILFTQEEINYSSVFTYSPIKRIGEISIESMFNFLSKLPEKDIVNFFSKNPTPIIYRDEIIQTKELTALQLLIYRRFDSLKYYKYDNNVCWDHFSESNFQYYISEEFNKIEPTDINCKIFRLFCDFYTIDEYSNDESYHYEHEIRFGCKLECCLKFKYFELIIHYFSDRSIKSFLTEVYDWNSHSEFKEKYLNKNYLGEEIYNYLLDVYKNYKEED